MDEQTAPAEPTIKRRRGRPPKTDRVLQPSKATRKIRSYVKDRLTLVPDAELKAGLDALGFILSASFRDIIRLGVDRLRQDLPEDKRTLFDEMVKLRLGQ